MTKIELLEPSMADVLKAIDAATRSEREQEDPLVVLGASGLHRHRPAAGKHSRPLVGR